MSGRVGRSVVLGLLLAWGMTTAVRAAACGTADPVYIPDPALETEIREQLGIVGRPILDSDLCGVTSINLVGNTDIVDLTGIEHFTGAQRIFLSNNAIADLSPLTALTQLKQLSLGNNGLTSIAPLASLTNLLYLTLSSNQISDLSPLSGLTGLQSLDLSRNPVSSLIPLAGMGALRSLLLFSCGLESDDLLPLAGLTALDDLYLVNNYIDDVSSLALLSQLPYLDLSNNRIQSLKPLYDNPNFGTAPGANFKFAGNPLTGESVCLHMQTFRDRGATVPSNPQCYTTADTTPCTGPVVPLPLLQLGQSYGGRSTFNAPEAAGSSCGTNDNMAVYYRFSTLVTTEVVLDATASTYATTVTAYLSCGGEEVACSDVGALQFVAQGGVEYLVRIGGNNGEDGYYTLAARLPLCDNDGEPLVIPDPALEAAFVQALEKSGPPVYEAELCQLTELILFNKGIADLSGIQYCTGLQVLSLNANPIADITPLSGLVQLYELDLSGTLVTDLTPLAGLYNLASLSALEAAVATVPDATQLTRLTKLYLDRNAVTDLSPIATASALEELRVSENAIASLAPIAGLTALMQLDASKNMITDLAPLAGLLDLEYLDLSYNEISSDALTQLLLLPKIETLILSNNGIDDITALTGLSTLAYLGLSYNTIADLGPLAFLTNLKDLIIRGNLYTSLEPLASLPALRTLDVSFSNVSDLQALVDNESFTSDAYDDAVVSTWAAPLSGRAVCIQIPTLRARPFTYVNADAWVRCDNGGPIDECATAGSMGITTPVWGTNVDAVPSDTSPCGDGMDTFAIWRTFTATGTYEYIVSTCGSDFDTTVTVYDACGGNVVACNDDAPECDDGGSYLTFLNEPGASYWVRVAGKENTTGTYRLLVTPQPIAEGEGEGSTPPSHTADQDGNFVISLSELLRVIQFYNSLGYHCADNPNDTEDGYVPGVGANQSCNPYDTDYNPQDWAISLSELLRIIQFYNSLGYNYCPLAGTEDDFCPGP